MFLLSFILVLAAAGLLIAGLAQGSSELIWGSIAASILAAIVLVVLVTGRRRSAAQPRTSGAKMQDPGRRAPSVAYDDTVNDEVTPVRAFSGGTPHSPELSDDELAARVAVLESELEERNADRDDVDADQIDADLASVDAQLDQDDQRPDDQHPDDARPDDAGAANAEDNVATDEVVAVDEVGIDDEAAADDLAGVVEPDGAQSTERQLVSDDAEVAPIDADDEPEQEQSSDADIELVGELDQDVFVIDGRPRYHLYTCSFLKDRDGIPIPIREAREDGFSPCARCTPDAVAGGAERRRLERAARATSTGASAPKIT